MERTKVKINLGYTLGLIAALLSILTPVLVLCYNTGQMTKQISINTGILQTVALKETVNELKTDNNKQHIDIKQEINGIDDKLDGVILRNKNIDKEVALSKLWINPYFDNGVN